jgi:hypothetical protein
MGGGGGGALGVLWGVPTITTISAALPMLGYNHLTDLLEI